MKKICIVTTDVILAYQPTILNLYDQLINHFEAEIISFHPEYISENKISNKNVVYLKQNIFLKKLLFWIDFAINITTKRIFKKLYQNFYYNSYFSKSLVRFTLNRHLKKVKADIFIVVDFMALAAFQQSRPSDLCHFLSLEIFENDKHRHIIKTNRIESVIIQTYDRYKYLFPTEQLKVFYIQNAPPSSDFSFKDHKTKSLIWAGSIIPQFGVLHCIKFIEKYPQFSLTLKGGGAANFLSQIKANFGGLIREGLLQIDNSYLDSKEFINYISDFKIGFCFYDIKLTRTSFNYRTAPSGKLFAYYAAAVPVIALNIPGLQSVNEFNTGILIDNYDPGSILQAILKIMANYKYYSENCKVAAAHFAFDRNCNTFINFLSGKYYC